MNLFGWVRRRRQDVALPPPGAPPPWELTPRPLRITAAALEALAAGGSNKPGVPGPLPNRPENPFRGLPTPPPGVRPEIDPVPKGMAMDDASGSNFGGQW